MTMMIRRGLIDFSLPFVVLVLTIIISTTTTTTVSARDLRGKSYSELNLSPQSRQNTVHGKDLQAILQKNKHQEQQQQQQQQRNLADFSYDNNNNEYIKVEASETEESGGLKFFAIYTEFGPASNGVGSIAGCRGLLYDHSMITAPSVSEEDVIGQLQCTCTVVGTSSTSEDHFCTYEFLFFTGGDTGFGTAIVTGSLTFAEQNGGHLLVEAAEDDFRDATGGIASVTYLSVEETFVFEAELTLR